jgi:hypothetical protein
MPDAFSISLSDGATPALKALMDQYRSRAFHLALGRRVERMLKRHFRAKDARGNRRGWWRSHFWNRRVANATQLISANEGNATITIAEPAFATHYYGGQIFPREAKALAIPLTTEAKEAGYPRAGRIPGLFRVGRFLVVSNFETAPSGARSRRLTFMYRLVGSVDIPRDPDALPPQSAFDEELLAGTNEYHRRHTPS